MVRIILIVLLMISSNSFANPMEVCVSKDQDAGIIAKQSKNKIQSTRAKSTSQFFIAPLDSNQGPIVRVTRCCCKTVSGGTCCGNSASCPTRSIPGCNCR